MPAVEEPIVFRCHDHQLMGILHHADPDTDLNIAVVNLVGGPQYRVGSHRQFVHTARALSRAGITTLRFDYRGMGDSDGTLRTFEEIDDDLDAALGLVRQRLPAHRIVVMGLCDAASAILMRAADAGFEPDGLVLQNPWVHTQQTAARARAQHYYTGRLTSWAFWRRMLRLEANPLRAVGSLLRDLREVLKADRSSSEDFLDRMARGLGETVKPVLIVLSSEDLTAREFQTVAGGESQWKELLSRDNVSQVHIEGADHTFSKPDALERLAAVIVSWLHREISGGAAGPRVGP